MRAQHFKWVKKHEHERVLRNPWFAVEPRVTDTRLIRPPRHCEQFALSTW